MNVPLSIIASGMITSLGNSAPSTNAALRAGVRRVSEGNIWDWTAGKNFNVGRPLMFQWWEGRDMLAELVAPAIEECTGFALSELGLNALAIPIVLIVATHDRPCRWPDLDRHIPQDLTRKLGRRLPEGSVLVPDGRTGIVRALRYASDLLAAGAHQSCIIAAVESFLRQDIADHYMLTENRLLTATNSNGFTLGEAASAVLVSASGRYDGSQLIIRGTGYAHDRSGAGGTSDEPTRAEGLTGAIREALSAAGMTHADIDLRISDANGEHWKFKEIAFATARLDRPRAPTAPPHRFGYLDHWHPIEFTGEVGAAIGPIALGWALDAGQNGYIDGPRVLVHTSEDNGNRSAIVAEFSTRAN